MMFETKEVFIVIIGRDDQSIPEALANLPLKSTLTWTNLMRSRSQL